jgi:hypothetical protein
MFLRRKVYCLQFDGPTGHQNHDLAYIEWVSPFLSALWWTS